MKKIFKKISVIFLSSTLFMNVVAFSLTPAVSATGDYHGFDTLEEYEAARKAAEEAARKAEEEEAKKAAHEAAVKAEEEMKAKEAAEEAARKAAEEAAKKAAEEEAKKAAEEALKKAKEEMKAKEAAEEAARKAAEEEAQKIAEAKEKLLNGDTEVGKALKEAIETAEYEDAKNVAEANATRAAKEIAKAETEVKEAEEKLKKAKETFEFAKSKFVNATNDITLQAAHDMLVMAHTEYNDAEKNLAEKVAKKAALEAAIKAEAEYVKKENELMNSLLQVVSVFGKVSGQSQEETDATIFSLEPRLWKNRHILIDLDKINTKGTTGAYTSVCLKLELTDGNYYIITGSNPAYEPRIELNIMLPVASSRIPVKEVGSGAFKGSRVKHIIIPVTITKIGSEALADCKKLKEIRYNGTMEQWNNIEFGEDWDNGTDNYYIRCSDGVIYK